MIMSADVQSSSSRALDLPAAGDLDRQLMIRMTANGQPRFILSMCGHPPRGAAGGLRAHLLGPCYMYILGPPSRLQVPIFAVIFARSSLIWRAENLL